MIDGGRMQLKSRVTAKHCADEVVLLTLNFNTYSAMIFIFKSSTLMALARHFDYM